MPINLFGPTYQLLETALDCRATRHSVVASNIANVETPGYSASRVSFEEALQRAMPASESGSLTMSTTHPGHLPPSNGIVAVEADVDYDRTSAQRPDGNTVDLDREIVTMSKNKPMYNAVSQVISRKFQRLRSAIKETK